MGEQALGEVRKLPRDNLSESDRVIWEQIDQLKGKDRALEKQIAVIERYKIREAKTVNTLGGAAIEVFKCPGVTSNMLCFAQVCVKGAVKRVVQVATCGSNIVTVEFDGDPADDHKVTLLFFY